MSEPRPSTPPTLAAAVAARRARVLLGSPRRLWRRSMRVRTVLITLVLSSVALLAVGTVVSYTIGQGLFNDRRDQVLAESSRAAAAAAQAASATATTLDPSTLTAASRNAVATAQTIARADAYVLYSSTGTLYSSSGTIQVGEGTLPVDSLRAALDRADDGAQLWQSVAIRRGGSVHPGIAVADTLRYGTVQGQLFLVYDLQDVQDTLDVVQRALLIGGLALLVLIAGVVTFVSGLVTAPLKQAAATSEQLAAGRLEQRIPVRGEDAVATLASSFNRMAESLQRQISQLANLSRVQQRFVSDVSHELRTPLTTIRLASDVLYDNRARYDAPTARSAELLRTQVQRFESLLADLLEISRMDARAAEVAGEPASLVDIATETIDALSGLAGETGSRVELVTPGGHAPVDVDARRITRIVRNLLANALEHGEGRPVVVTVDSSADAVALGVRDHGIGMSAEDAGRVFDRFWRADPSRQRRVGGTGLGLAISLEDAMLHGGALEVWSRPGEGANFVLTLPRGDGPTADRPVPLRPDDVGARPSTRTGRTAAVAT
ncbi:MtrAB system histidine kinase MtrB [Amnibacterium endophyticum]|uniref:Sensor histidine kinase MtrB n=1 Tax=Amnibacterium endophyticum TaxID=2109337 RepID=A0ABW4LA80_9MICO